MGSLTTIAIPRDLEDRIRALVKDDPGALMLRAIEDYVSDLEDARLGRERLDALKAGRSDTVALSELMERHGVAD